MCVAESIDVGLNDGADSLSYHGVHDLPIPVSFCRSLLSGVT